MAGNVREGWYSWVGSNHRPPVPHIQALGISLKRLPACEIEVLNVAPGSVPRLRARLQKRHPDLGWQREIHIENGRAKFHGALDVLCDCRTGYKRRQHHAPDCFCGDLRNLVRVSRDLRPQPKLCLWWQSPLDSEGRDFVAHLFEQGQAVGDLLREGAELIR